MASEKIDALELDIISKGSTENIDKLIEALGKLSTALGKVQSKKVSVNIKQTGAASKDAAASADKLTNSFLNQTVKIAAVIALFKKLSSVISDSVANSLTYNKTLNMFTVSLGEYADNATKYGQTVSDALGIDIAGWQNAQGIFQTLITGFGVTGDKAAYMSQNLTQLTYDIASFYNLTNEEAANKLKSALSGRLEPIRKLGYDLSQAKLVDIAKNPANYGKQTFSINEQTGAVEANTKAVDDNTKHKIVNFNQLTQEEKVQLRYIALMTEVTQVQGNYARALNDPANQMKVFKEQLNMTSRAFGNMFIPALNKVLPYLSAFAQLAAEAFQSLANLFGFQLPDMKDRTDISGNLKPYNDVVKATGNAAKNAKKMKDYMLGIDELNVFNPNTGAGGAGGVGGGQNSNLKNLKLPGYDFLSKAVENSIKKAKETIKQFFDDLKKNPFLLKDIFIWGGQELFSKFWEKVLGKTPEELKAEAEANGRTIGEQFIVSLAGAIEKHWGEAGSNVWAVILGKTPDELAKDADERGVSIGTAFWGGLADKIPGINSDAVISVPFMDAIFGTPDQMAKRALEAGRTVGEQFSLEFQRAVIKSGKGNPLFEALSKMITGKSIDDILAGLDKELGKKAKQKSKNAIEKNPYRYVSADTAKKLGAINSGESKKFQTEDLMLRGIEASEATYIEYAKKNAKAYRENFVAEVQKDKASVTNATNEVAKSAYNGISGNGQNELKYKYVSADMAKAFASGFTTKTAKAEAYNATAGLALQGVKGAKSQNGLTGGFGKAGTQAGSGFILGINSEKNLLKYKKSGDVVAKTTLKALKDFLLIKSPSRKTMELGDYTGEGFAVGIENSTKLVTNASKSLASSALTSLQSASELSNKIVLNGTIADPMNAKASIPSTANAGYGVGAANEGAMASLASSVYQAVVNGMATANTSVNGNDIKVVIDGKEVFKAVQTEQRKRGAVVSNGAFSR